jgi:hypothetical protein
LIGILAGVSPCVRLAGQDQTTQWRKPINHFPQTVWWLVT